MRTGCSTKSQRGRCAPTGVWLLLLLLLPMALGVQALSGSAGAATRSAVPPFTHPTKALCKRANYKIGYTVFSGTQPFADLVGTGIEKAAKSIGCVTILKTIDNDTGPTAVSNVKTLISEGINGLIDFNILEPYQPAIAKEMKSAKIPGDAVIGATLPGWPGVGAKDYTSAYKDGLYLADQAKKRYPKTVPYVIGGAEDTSGPLILGRYTGALAAEQKVYPGLPSSHIVEVQTKGLETTAYSNALSALSKVPSGSLVLLTGVNDEATGGLFKAAVARGFKKILVNSYGGDTYGMSQVCSQSNYYVGAWYLEPLVWGRDALSVVLDEINNPGMHVPKTVGVLGAEIVRSGAEKLHCK